jgi:hypothetical protein
MPFRINIDDPLSLRDAPLTDAPAAAGTVDSIDLLEKIADAADGWCKVKVVTPGAPTREGFVRSDLLTEAEQPGSDQIDEKAFFRRIADAAERFGANRDYLFAVAVAESGLKNVKGAQSSAVGPFKFKPETWHGLVEKHGAERGITDADITDPGSQPAFAAIQSVDDQAKLSKILNDTPTPAQLYCAHLLGIGAASALLTRDPTILIVEALRDFADVVASNSGLLADKTVGQVLEALAVRLDPGVKKAAALAADLGLVSSSPGQPATTATVAPGTDYSKTGTGDPSLIKGLYAAARHNGFSDLGARHLVAEINRENSFRPDLIWGTHIDPANRETNGGIISWQGSRRTNLMHYLAQMGAIDNQGSMIRSQANLDAQFGFVAQEMRQKQWLPAYKYFTDPSVNFNKEQAIQYMGGRGSYIGWALDNPRYREAGLKNINSGYDLVNKAVPTTVERG